METEGARSASKRRRLPGDLRILVAVVMILSGLVDLPRMIDFGVISGLGAVTILFAFLATIVWIARGLIPRVVARAIWPFVLLIALGLASFVRAPPSDAGVQSILILVVFVAVILSTGAGSYLYSDLWRYAGTLLAVTTLLVGAVYGLTMLLWGLGNEQIYEARGFALFAVTGLAWFLSGNGATSGRARWLGLGILLLIALSLSRTATVAAVALVPLAFFRPTTVRGWVQLFVAVAAVAGLLYLAITRFEPLRERFVGGITEPVSIAGIEISGSGRAAFWDVTWQSYTEAPLLGKGPGSSQELLEKLYPIAHPHNDYLRILHDYGALGMGLWGLGVLRLLWMTWMARLRAESAGQPEARIHMAAFLGLLALSITMIATNAWVFAFTMGPIAVLVGCALGRIRRPVTGGIAPHPADARPPVGLGSGV